MVAGPSLASPIISPAAIIKTLKNLAGKIGKRNAQVYNQGGFAPSQSFGSSAGYQQSDFGNGFSDGTDFGQTFVDFGVSSGSSSSGYDSGSCTTTYEEQCSTVNEQVCNTVNEQQCRFVSTYCQDIQSL